MEPQMLLELRVRYDALRLSDEDEVMAMLLAAACQLAHRNECHPGAVLVKAGEQTKELWADRWGAFIHDTLEADDE